MAEVSHALSELQKEGTILYYYKFPESKMSSLVISDHFVILPSKKVIFFEEKSGKKGKIGMENIFGENKKHQVYYNEVLFSNHFYLFRFSEKGEVCYTYSNIISNLKAKAAHKSYISKNDFLLIFEGKSSLKNMLESLINGY